MRLERGGQLPIGNLAVIHFKVNLPTNHGYDTNGEAVKAGLLVRFAGFRFSCVNGLPKRPGGAMF